MQVSQQQLHHTTLKPAPQDSVPEIPVTSLPPFSAADYTRPPKTTLPSRDVALVCNVHKIQNDPLVDIPESTIAFGQSIPGSFNDHDSPLNDSLLLLNPSGQADQSISMVVNKGILSCFFDFSRTRLAFDGEKQRTKANGSKQILELLELNSSEFSASNTALAEAIYLCHLCNEDAKNQLSEYTRFFDRQTCLAVIHAIDNLDSSQLKVVPKQVVEQLWRDIERHMLSAVCDCAIKGVVEEDENKGRMLLISVHDSEEGAIDYDLVQFDSVKLDEIVEGINQDISSIPNNCPVRKRLATTASLALAPCTSSNGGAAANRLIDQPLQDQPGAPASYFSDSPRWMTKHYYDYKYREDYGYFLTPKPGVSHTVLDELLDNYPKGSNWSTQTRTYTHPERVGYRMTSVAEVKA